MHEILIDVVQLINYRLELLVEMIDKHLEILLGFHAWLNMRHAAHIVALQTYNRGDERLNVTLVNRILIKRKCHTFSEKGTANVGNVTF